MKDSYGEEYKKEYETGYDLFEKYVGLEYFVIDVVCKKYYILSECTPSDVVSIDRLITNKNEVLYIVAMEIKPWEWYKEIRVIQSNNKYGFKLISVRSCTDKVLEKYGVS